MSELIREWLLGISSAAILLALIDQIVPEGGAKKVVTLAGGVFLVLVAISPIIKIDESALKDLTGQYQSDVQERSEELRREQEFLFESIIEEQTAAYILDKANELGVSCRVSVTVAWSDEAPVPHTITLWGSWTKSQRDELRQWIETELGVPASMQHFEEFEQ